MKIAIHNREGSFSDRWINYCKKNDIPYKIVNVYESNIIEQVSDCSALMWHHHHGIYQDTLFAKQLSYSLQMAGKSVFPDFATCWHFDDKVGQKYLLESINVPFISTYVFYSKIDALKWIDKATFPKVFKLRGGAGSSNVKLLKNKKEAFKFAKRAFGKGFKTFNSWENFTESWHKFIKGKISFKGVLYRFHQVFFTAKNLQIFPKEKGYFYAQDFIPDNTFDIRVIVIGEKAFAIKRITRENDFRASGSGIIIYRKEEIDERCVKIAFDVNYTINSQCIAYDFVFDSKNNPLIIEISFGFHMKGYDLCEGYWNKNLDWFDHKIDPLGWVIEDLIQSTVNNNV